MTRSHVLRLNDMIEAMVIIQHTVSHGDFNKFENDRMSQMIVERGLEIVSEASRHLHPEMKQRHPDIPWKSIQNIGNVLRHEYDKTEQSLFWETACHRVPELLAVCRAELERASTQTAR